MSEPLIKQWQNRPPQGGWGMNYEYKGQEFNCRHPNPYGVVEQIANILKINNDFHGYDVIWEYCNNIWRGRDPDRALQHKGEGAGLFRMAVNLAKDIVKVGKAAIEGKPISTDLAKAAERIAICVGCDEFQPKRKRCGKCGCFLEWKTLLDAVNCPLKKW